MRSSVLCVSLLALASFALAASAVTFKVLCQLKRIPLGWSQVRDAAPEAQLMLKVFLQHANPALLDQASLDVSTPGNPKYGQHLTREEVEELVKPAEGAADSVVSWLKSVGITSCHITNAGQWISFRASVSQAEKLLDTKFAVFRHSGNNVERIRTLHYSVPKSISPFISMVQPTTRFRQFRKPRSTITSTRSTADFKIATGPDSSPGSADCINNEVTPACLRALYDIGDYNAQPNCGFMGIAGYLEEYPRFDDLNKFIAKYAPDAQNRNFTSELFHGGLLDQNSTSDSVEANLDIQYTMALSDPTPNVYYSTAGRGPLVPDLDEPDRNMDSNEPYIDFLTAMLKKDNDQLPHTLTTSYGEDEQSVPREYAIDICRKFQQLGVRGVSILFSSGDTGVGSACQTNDGKNTTRFLPIFPAACPYVTSVGGTVGIAPEKAVSFSSGGFSDIWKRPKWQDTAVKRYLKQLDGKWTKPLLYNPDGRGFPDVSAQGFNFHVFDKGSDLLVSGTSASAPTMAGIIALINGARISNGKPPLGWLNPFIYSDDAKYGWTDITNGGSTGCTGIDEFSGLPTPFVANASWPALAGWDAVTGMVS